MRFHLVAWSVEENIWGFGGGVLWGWTTSIKNFLQFCAKLCCWLNGFGSSCTTGEAYEGGNCCQV